MAEQKRGFGEIGLGFVLTAIPFVFPHLPPIAWALLLGLGSLLILHDLGLRAYHRFRHKRLETPRADHAQDLERVRLAGKAQALYRTVSNPNFHPPRSGDEPYVKLRAEIETSDDPVWIDDAINRLRASFIHECDWALACIRDHERADAREALDKANGLAERLVATLKGEPLPEIKITYDVWLCDAAWRVYLGRWHRQQKDVALACSEQSANDAFFSAVKKIKQAAFDGDLPTWGKVGPVGSVWKLIPKEDWENEEFGLHCGPDYSPEEVHLARYATASSFTSGPKGRGNWGELKTSRAAVEKLWP